MRLLGLSAVLFLIFASAAQAEVPQKSCDAWQRGGIVAMEGTSEDGGLSGKLSMLIDVHDGRYVQRRDYGVFAIADGFDGTTAWSQDHSGASHDLNAPAARAIAVTQSFILRHGWCGAAHVTVEAMPDETDHGVAEKVWQVTPAGGIPAILRFDAKTGMLRQSEYRMWGNRLIRHYDDWRLTPVSMAFAERDEDPEDEDTETIKFTSATMRDAVPPSAFARPPQPNDSEILNGKSSATVPYEDDGVGRIYVPVTIDGKGPFAFEIDTGGHLIITPDVAAKLAVTAVGHMNNTGAGTGIAHSGVTRLSEIRIGDAVMRNLPAKVIGLSPAANNRGTKPPRAGLLGLELFERFAVHLDRRARTVTLTPLAGFKGDARGIPLPIRFIEDAPITRGSFNGIAGDFEIDSGDAGPAIIEGYWAEQHGLTKRLSHGLVWTGGGMGGEYPETLTRGDYTLGALRLPNQVTSYVGTPERGSESTRLEAGVVGESSLYRFDTTFDYSRGIITIDPAPKVPERGFNGSGLRLKKAGDGKLVAAIVVPGTPAARAGIKAGDEIHAIAGQPSSQLSAVDGSVLLSGKPGSMVDVSVIAKGSHAARIVRLTLENLVH